VAYPVGGSEKVLLTTQINEGHAWPLHQYSTE